MSRKFKDVGVTALLARVEEGQGKSEIVSSELEEKQVIFQAYAKAHPRTPKKRPYRFNYENLVDLKVGMDLGLNIMITGPTGCGKTSLPIALAAELGRPVVRFNCNGETRVSGLVGMSKPAAKDGVLTLEFSPGVLVKALKEGYWVIFDEIDAAPPGVLMVLQPVLEEGTPSLHVPETNETVTPHPDCQIFATGNTLGYRANARAAYAGTNVMNAAFLDRFGMVISTDYPHIEEEKERVKINVPGCDDLFVEAMCRVAFHLRRDKAFRSDFSTRRIIQWARLLPHYHNSEYYPDLHRTFELAVVRKLTSASDVRVARETISRVVGYTQ